MFSLVENYLDKSTSCIHKNGLYISCVGFVNENTLY
jgi:hypothetical protein